MTSTVLQGALDSVLFAETLTAYGIDIVGGWEPQMRPSELQARTKHLRRVKAQIRAPCWPDARPLDGVQDAKPFLLRW